MSCEPYASLTVGSSNDSVPGYRRKRERCEISGGDRLAQNLAIENLFHVGPFLEPAEKMKTDMEQAISDKYHVKPLSRRLAKVLLKHFMPQSKYKREFPNLYMGDTYTDSFLIVLNFMTREGKGLVEKGLTQKERNYFRVYHIPGLSYEDKDIIAILALPGEARLDNKMPLLQIGQRGCTGATPAMIASDITGIPFPAEKCNLGDDDSIILRLHKMGLRERISYVNTLKKLQKKITQVGSSAIVSVETIGAHSVVVDAIKKDRVEIRDPYHGWAVAITREAFVTSWGNLPHKIIQASV